jgi:hypothetical protein
MAQLGGGIYKASTIVSWPSLRVASTMDVCGWEMNSSYMASFLEHPLLKYKCLITIFLLYDFPFDYIVMKNVCMHFV